MIKRRVKLLKQYDTAVEQAAEWDAGRTEDEEDEENPIEIPAEPAALTTPKPRLFVMMGELIPQFRLTFSCYKS